MDVISYVSEAETETVAEAEAETETEREREGERHMLRRTWRRSARCGARCAEAHGAICGRRGRKSRQEGRRARELGVKTLR